jgi:hypothetical protein
VYRKVLRVAFSEALIMLRHDFEVANIRCFDEKLVTDFKLLIRLRFVSKSFSFNSYVLYLQNILVKTIYKLKISAVFSN